MARSGSTSSLVNKITGTFLLVWSDDKSSGKTLAKARDEGQLPGTIECLARAVLDAPPASDAAIEQAKLLLLDTIGCGFAGGSEAVAQAVVKTALASAGAGPCAVIGYAKHLGALGAVLANGAAVRVLDLNDYIVGTSANGEPESGGHPSDNIPVALAVGTERARSGRDVLNAIAVGYELYARLQRSMDRGGNWDGVTATGLVAPAMAGMLMGMGQGPLTHALALGAARATTPSIVRGGDISATKSIANALVAQAGVQAALLAEQGVTGPLAVLDHERGLRDIFARRETLTAPFTSEGAITGAHIKAYPCINTAQSAVAAALQLHPQFKRRAVTRVEVTMADYKVVKRHQDDEARSHPKSREAADHSFPFLIAVALIDGALTIAQFECERWRDENVKQLTAKIVMRRDKSWNERAPGSYPCSLRITDDAGHVFEAEVPYPPGFSRNGLDRDTVFSKFHAVTEPILNPSARERIVDAVMQFDHSPSLAVLNAAISKGTAK